VRLQTLPHYSGRGIGYGYQPAYPRRLINHDTSPRQLCYGLRPSSSPSSPQSATMGERPSYNKLQVAEALELPVSKCFAQPPDSERFSIRIVVERMDRMFAPLRRRVEVYDTDCCERISFYSVLLLFFFVVCLSLWMIVTTILQLTEAFRLLTPLSCGPDEVTRYTDLLRTVSTKVRVSSLSTLTSWSAFEAVLSAVDSAQGEKPKHIDLDRRTAHGRSFASQQHASIRKVIDTERSSGTRP
jgi:hypothetical protein